VGLDPLAELAVLQSCTRQDGQEPAVAAFDVIPDLLT
jgi:hypothetical protein